MRPPCAERMLPAYRQGPRRSTDRQDGCGPGPAARGGGGPGARSPAPPRTPSPSGTWARTVPQGSTIMAWPCEARPGPWRARLRGGDDVGQVLDGAGAQQHLPVVLAGALGERRRHGQHARAAARQRGGTARGSAGRSRSRARAARRRVSATTTSSPGSTALDSLRCSSAGQVDVEEVDLAVDRERARRRARAAPRCCGRACRPSTRLGQAAEQEQRERVRARAPAMRAHPGAVERLRLGDRLALGAQEREVLGQRRRSARRARAASSTRRSAVSRFALDVGGGASSAPRRPAPHARARPARPARLLPRRRAHGVCLALRPAAQGEHRALAAAAAGARRRSCGRGR